MNPRLQAVRRCAALKLLRTRVLYPVTALHLPGEGQMQSGRAGSAPDNKLRQSPQQAALRLQSAYSASRDSFLKDGALRRGEGGREHEMSALLLQL